MSQTPRHINTDRSLSRPDQAAQLLLGIEGGDADADGARIGRRVPRRLPRSRTPAALPGRSTPRRPAMQHSPIWAGTMHRAAAKKRKRPRCGCPLPS